MAELPSFLATPPRHLFFTGKGGVGKTSIACASAIALAAGGKRVLLVSTDPASNLDEMLGVALSDKPRPVPDVPGLSALNIDPEAAAEAYRGRVLETTPVSEAAALQEDLRRAGIEPQAWVVNRALASSGASDPLLRQRVAGEAALIARLQARLARRLFLLPWQAEAPVGLAALRRLAR